ncbi:SulP family inorganic anion transporter [Nocardioides stalactiti]|uniref:SulP family inorganic anion transporter n=1 Tax=Nocardioides stalactiti TaxID=2755356 RepID=UPI00160017FC|nr:SulP family inorganic anion transporter [Nocardioides stalactiti]
MAGGERENARSLRGDLLQLGRRAHSLRPRTTDWTQSRPRRDLTAGVMVGLVALPLALGFGASSGMGATAGLITAIVAGATAAIFGGSRVQVSGPTGAMTVVLVPIFATHGPEGVLVVGVLAGIILVGLSLGGAGRFIRYVPVPVVEGFTLGIAGIIALQQLPAALGVEVRGENVMVLAADTLLAWVESPVWTPVGMTLGVTVAILVVARIRPSVPGSLLAVALATAANSVLQLGAATIAHIPVGLPAPRLPSVPLGDLSALVLPAIAVAALAALESLLSATVADAMSVGQRHDSNRELFGQGLANLVAPLFGGVPATAAIARTAVNVRAGATSRLAALSHALVLLGVALVAAGWVSEIPLAALAGVLVATAIQMVRFSSLRAVVRSTRGDAAVLIITAAATVLFDLVTAVILGLVVAGFIALQQTARTARIDEVPLDDADHIDEELSLLDEHIVAFRIDGPLFFAAAHDFLLELSEVATVRVVILRMSRVTTIDATGAHVLADTISRLEGRGVTVLLSGVQPTHARVLRELGVYGRLAHERHLFDDTPAAIAHGRLHASRIAHAAATHPHEEEDLP